MMGKKLAFKLHRLFFPECQTVITDYIRGCYDGIVIFKKMLTFFETHTSGIRIFLKHLSRDNERDRRRYGKILITVLCG